MQINLSNLDKRMESIPEGMRPVAERHVNFGKLLKQIDEITEREKIRTFYELKEKRDEKEAEQAKRLAEKRIEEVLDEMASFKSKAVSGDSAAAAQLSILSAELLRLMLFQ